MQYRTLENLRKDGRDIAPGQLVELPDDIAAKLLASGAIEPARKSFSRPAAGPDELALIAP